MKSVRVWICAVNGNGLLEKQRDVKPPDWVVCQMWKRFWPTSPQMNDRCDIFPANTNIFSDFSCWGYTRDKKAQTTVTAKWGWILFLDFFIYFYNFHSIPRLIVELHVKTGCLGRTRWSWCRRPYLQVLYPADECFGGQCKGFFLTFAFFHLNRPAIVPFKSLKMSFSIRESLHKELNQSCITGPLKIYVSDEMEDRQQQIIRHTSQTRKTMNKVIFQKRVGEKLIVHRFWSCFCTGTFCLNIRTWFLSLLVVTYLRN